MVVAVCAISYASYVLQKLTKRRGGVLLAALLGGAYSSTVTTVALVRRVTYEDHPHLFAGGILAASGMMYLRLFVLLGFFNRNLMKTLALPFLVLAAIGMGGGWFWSRRADARLDQKSKEFAPKNPLELRAAFLFALLFIAILCASHLALAHLGKAGVYSLAAVMGLTDVDPFIMSMTQEAAVLMALKTAAASVVIATASNNVVKGCYAYGIGDRKTGRQSLWLLTGLAILGLVPLIWLIG